MVENVVLTVRTSSGIRVETHPNAAEARRSLISYVRKNRWRINGNGHRGVLLARSGPNSPVEATYDIN
ncbi:MAG: hypothetical protein ACKODT_07245 [Fluviibacter sp.]